MKKRALISAIAGIALAGVMAVGFAACGSESAKSVKGDEVDKATWDTAMKTEDYDNYKAVVVSESVMKQGDITVTMKIDCTITVVGDAQHIKGKSTTTIDGELPDEAKDYYKAGEEELDYYIKGEDIIAKKDGNWTKIEDASESAYPVDAKMINYFISVTDYEKYEYNAEQKGYVLKDAEEGELLVVKIKGGKLKAVYMEEEYGPEGAKSTATVETVLTHGGQKVEVPSVS